MCLHADLLKCSIDEYAACVLRLLKYSVAFHWFIKNIKMINFRGGFVLFNIFIYKGVLSTLCFKVNTFH